MSKAKIVDKRDKVDYLSPYRMGDVIAVSKMGCDIMFGVVGAGTSGRRVNYFDGEWDILPEIALVHTITKVNAEIIIT